MNAEPVVRELNHNATATNGANANPAALTPATHRLSPRSPTITMTKTAPRPVSTASNGRVSSNTPNKHPMSAAYHGEERRAALNAAHNVAVATRAVKRYARYRAECSRNSGDTAPSADAVNATRRSPNASTHKPYTATTRPAADRAEARYFSPKSQSEIAKAAGHPGSY